MNGAIVPNLNGVGKCDRSQQSQMSFSQHCYHCIHESSCLTDRIPRSSPSRLNPSDRCRILRSFFCLSRHQESPTDFQLEDDQEAMTITLLWEPPSPQTRLAWANTTDATEARAYACALAAIAHTRELSAIQRAETRTGSDYYIAPVSYDRLSLSLLEV